MAEVLGIAASVMTLLKTSRTVADGITRLTSLRHAPDVLLALNNEAADLQLVLEDLTALPQRFTDKLPETINLSFLREVERAKSVLAGLENLIAYRLTKFSGKTGRLSVDRSQWLWVYHKIPQALQDVRDCRLKLVAATNILNSSTSIDSYNHVRRFGVDLDAIITENAQFREALARHMVGMEIQQRRGNGQPNCQGGGTCPGTDYSSAPLKRSSGRGNPAPSIDTSGLSHDGIEACAATSIMQIQFLRRYRCAPPCQCACHQTQRLRLPHIAENFIGRLFLGYAGVPLLTQKCNTLACRQNSPAIVKLAYRFPYWIWQRALNMVFTYSSKTGPQLVLRFPCVRPMACEWFEAARQGYVGILKDLLDRKQACREFYPVPTAYRDLVDRANPIVHDIEDYTGMTALHIQPVKIGLACRSLQFASRNLVDERSIPRHCLLFEYFATTTEAKSQALLLERYRIIDDVPEHDIFEEPRLHTFYREAGADPAFHQAIATASPTELDETDIIGETLLFKATRGNDPELVRQLLQFGACPMQRNKHGTTCVAIACQGGLLEIVRHLMDHGADLAVGCFWSPYRSALTYLIANNRHDVLRYLLLEQSYIIRHVPATEEVIKLVSRMNLKQSTYRRPMPGFLVTELQIAASYADLTTLKILKAAQWDTTDILELLNDGNSKMWRPRKIATERRDSWKCGIKQSNVGPQEDREQIYQAFMSLIQKLIDDRHAGFAPPRKRMVPLLRKDSWSWDIVEEDSVSTLPATCDDDGSDSDEIWEDAPEQLTQDATADEEAQLEKVIRHNGPGTFHGS
ncbi:MAG: hypothetical protein Q9218_004556 [Villophora microphyllina]